MKSHQVFPSLYLHSSILTQNASRDLVLFYCSTSDHDEVTPLTNPLLSTNGPPLLPGEIKFVIKIFEELEQTTSPNETEPSYPSALLNAITQQPLYGTDSEKYKIGNLNFVERTAKSLSQSHLTVTASNGFLYGIATVNV